jgi:hypothetical protein
MAERGSIMTNQIKTIMLSVALTLSFGANIPIDIESGRDWQNERLNDDAGLYFRYKGSPVFFETQVLGSQIDSWRSLVSKYFPAHEVDNALKIIQCESGGNANAHNFNHRTRDNSHGLFQINNYGNLAHERPSREWLIIPENNVSYAYKLYLQEGGRFGTTGGWFNCAKLHGIR